MKSRFQRSMSVIVFTLFMGIGTYNAVVINSESHIRGADFKFVKRMDSLYGTHHPARLVANSIKWQKLTPGPEVLAQTQIKPIVQEIRNLQAAPQIAQDSVADAAPVAAVQEELTLNLVEVVNPKKWQQGLQTSQFSGTLSTSNGTIESLSVSLPNGEGVSISFSEMAGNVFEYDLNGEIYAGMMYQVDQTAYMISLTNGPLEGTRLKFVGDQAEKLEEIQAQEVATQGTNTEADNFGQPAATEANSETEVAQAPAEVIQEPAPEAYNPPLPLEVAFEPQPISEMADPANLDLQYQQQGLQVQGGNQDQPQMN